ncbi:hypothetical protein D9619_004169 [Psilocybe cf. subviscida]|uniref:Uncharacterized protein n=1 Tax=Psilocybe cf. subviscida TaxID=2480587 RepID=A0A8H5BQW3_9AGAR|nr:hypothetical protein D9619_004169 [Psilocybe cf. subviscida]
MRVLSLCSAANVLVSFTYAQTQSSSIGTTAASFSAVSSPTVANAQIRPSQPPLVIPTRAAVPAIGAVIGTSTANAATNTLLAPAAPPLPTWDVIPPGVPRTKSGKPIPCSPKNVKLNPSSHKLISECIETTFCAAPPGAPVNATGLGICFPRQCRRDVYPFGYGTFGGGTGPKKVLVKGKFVTNMTAVAIPPMCANGLFCPDNGSGCQLLKQIGESCELGRDEQCQAPSSDGAKAVCLNLTCMAATLSLNDPCTIENTTYVSDINRGAAGGGQYTTIVIKDNCRSPGLFCDPTPPNSNNIGPACQQTKKLTGSCRFDNECDSRNCNLATKKCAIPSETPLHVAPWHWAATAILILLWMSASFIVLLFVDRRRQFFSYQKMKTYYIEQMTLRRAILSLHAAAIEQRAPIPALYSPKKQ